MLGKDSRLHREKISIKNSSDFDRLFFNKKNFGLVGSLMLVSIISVYVKKLEGESRRKALYTFS